MKSELQNGDFLFIDDLPQTRRAQAYTELRQGEILLKQMNTQEEGHPIPVEHGLIHDWIGVLFIPNTSLSQTLAVVQDYDNYQNFYKPEIRRSELLNHEGDNFKVFLQLYKKTVVTVAIDANFDVRYERFGTNLVLDRSYATRLAEVKDPGKTDEHELPDGG